MSDIPYWYAGDLDPSIEDTVTSGGDPVDLTSADAITFRMRAVGSDTLLVDAAGSTNGDPTLGGVVYDWVDGDTDQDPGFYLVSWVVTFDDRDETVGEGLIEIRALSPLAGTYVEVDELKKTLELEGSSFADKDIHRALRTATEVVELHTGQVFSQTANQARLYTALRGETLLRVDAFSTLDTLLIDEDGDGVYETEWTEGTEFVVGPANAALDDQPYTYLKILPQSGATFPVYENAIKVTGTFGWPTVPEIVKTCVEILASRYLKRARETPYGFQVIVGDAVTAARLGRIDPDVGLMLDQLGGGTVSGHSVQLQ